MTYQGHINDSGVQKHSAGDTFPYVVAKIVRTCEDGAVSMWHEIYGPGLPCPMTVAGQSPDALARRLRVASENADAFSFLLERCFAPTGQRDLDALLAYRRATERLFGGRSLFGELTPAERVRALIAAGDVWNMANAGRFTLARPEVADWAEGCSVFAD